MKYLMIGLLVIFMMGCTIGQIQTDSASQEILAKIAGRRVGYELGKNYPNAAAKIKELSCVENSSNRIAEILLADVAPLLKFEIEMEITPDQQRIMKAVIEGLTEGINIGEKENGE
jgi:hypothetical protein